MREDGLHLKTSALALQHHVDMPGTRKMIPELSREEELLKKLTLKQKQQLYRKLKKLQKKLNPKKKKNHKL